MDYMKKPCQHCPFRSDVTPFLHPERGEELAYGSQNPYWSFACHKTTECDEDSEDGEMYAPCALRSAPECLPLERKEARMYRKALNHHGRYAIPNHTKWQRLMKKNGIKTHNP